MLELNWVWLYLGLVGWIGLGFGVGEGCNDFVDENRESASEVPGSGVQ